MVIEIRLHDILKSYAFSGTSGIVTVDVLGDITVGELLDELEIDRELVKFILINNQKSDFNQLLHDGDKLSLYARDGTTHK